MDCDLIVVGGGPAGMMAAGAAAERGLRVLLLERGPSVGRKLLLTGNGRCNVTRAAPLSAFLSAFGRRGGFLRAALAEFGSEELVAWLQERGVLTAKEPDGRVFPATHDARTVLDALLSYVVTGRAEVRLRQCVTALLIEDGRLRGVRTAEGAHRSASVVVATGGLSYPSTGSTGDGYTLARQAGHAIVPTYPAIAALETREQWPRSLQGTPIRAAELCARDEMGRRLARARGDALWTHYGLSGPAALEVSTAAVRALMKGHEVSIECDLLPEQPEEALEQELRLAARTTPKMALKAALAGWLPRRTAEMLLEIAGVGAATRLGQCSKAEARAVVKLLKRLRVHVTGPRPVEEAIVTGGGVSLEEVDSRTMESRLLAGLHFAGETLDVQGPCGGFNLQAAFSTGRLAGRSVRGRMREGNA